MHPTWLRNLGSQESGSAKYFASCKETSGYCRRTGARFDMFDYNAGAELFPRRSRGSSSQVGYRRFASAADAIQFAMEVLPSALLPGTFLEVDEQRLGAQEIRDLYEDEGFPLPRKPGKA
jgi:hypothetical protein